MKRNTILVVLGISLGLGWGCSSTQSAADIAIKAEQFEAMKALVATKSFTIDVKTAHPLQTQAVTQITNALLRNTGNNAGRIDVTGNFIEVMGDSVQAGLSYFGEVRIANSLDPNDAGINFEGEPLSYEVSDNEKKQTVTVEFDVRGKTEPFMVIIQLFPNKRAAIFVNSPYRNSIRYDGVVKSIADTNAP